MFDPEALFLRRGDLTKIAQRCGCSHAYVRFVIKNHYVANTALYDKVIAEAEKLSRENKKAQAILLKSVKNRK